MQIFFFLYFANSLLSFTRHGKLYGFWAKAGKWSLRLKSNTQFAFDCRGQFTQRIQSCTLVYNLHLIEGVIYTVAWLENKDSVEKQEREITSETVLNGQSWQCSNESDGEGCAPRGGRTVWSSSRARQSLIGSCCYAVLAVCWNGAGEVRRLFESLYLHFPDFWSQCSDFLEMGLGWGDAPARVPGPRGGLWWHRRAQEGCWKLIMDQFSDAACCLD